MNLLHATTEDSGLPLVRQRGACAMCGETEAELVHRDLRNRRGGLDGSYDLRRCVQCGLAFLSPRPSPHMLASMYAGDYHSHTISPERGWPLKAIKALCLLPYRLRFGNETSMFPPFGGGRILDVGCGTGDYLTAMSALGWRCFGCDVSETAVKMARRRLPRATVYHGTLEELSLDRDLFEVVTLWHTLEHLEDPLAALKRVRDLLVPNGRVFVAVPNIDSYEARLFGRRWLELDIPGHLFYFSVQTLRALLEKAGFEWTNDRPQVHPSTVSDCLDFHLDDLLGVKRSRQRPWLYFALFPFVAASYVLGNRGCVEVIARKG